MTPLESPIEWKFAAAVRDHLDGFYIKEFPPTSIEELIKAVEELPWPPYVCAPQVTIGLYRVDFAFAGYCFDERPALIAVECDGHDFHERDKWQAQRDKARDRYFASHGIHVMRFTGSEIHRDASKCAREVYAFLESHGSRSFDRMNANNELRKRLLAERLSSESATEKLKEALGIAKAPPQSPA